MEIRPGLDEVLACAAQGEYQQFPVYTELLSDVRTPIQVLRALKNVSSHTFILESVEGHERWGRYTFLGFDPGMVITCTDGLMRLGDRTVRTDDPNAYIRQVLSSRRSPRVEGLPPFTGGLVGYFSYDYLKYAEPTLHLDAEDSEQFRDVDLMLFDKVICFDHFRQKIILIVNISLADAEKEYRQAEITLAGMKELVTRGAMITEAPGRLKGEFQPLFSREEYCAMVEKARYHIYEGDIFQIVLSNRLEAEYEGGLLNAYRVLRTQNPSPYMFYFSGTDVEVAGASPETLVKLQDGALYTYPLAGTRPRGKTPEEDRALELELLAEPKELAEHNMLVDLGRNDLGKISRFGSVRVEKLHAVERYSHVMHIGSTVRGDIRPDRDALDAVNAILPAGTLSGAPKIRACQLINDLENNKRGIYGGAIGYLDFTGNLDTCIAIRIAYLKNGKVFVRSGAGIVADSVPDREFEECLHKAAAVIQAVRQADKEADET